VVIVPSNSALPTQGVAGGANFVFRLTGFITTSALPYGVIGRFNMDGTGVISAGVLDVNIAQADGSSAPYSEVPFTGSYTMLTSRSGTAQFTFTSPPWAAITNPLPTTLR
jgi:hypothetical protein